jgi:hypothetical protein
MVWWWVSLKLLPAPAHASLKERYPGDGGGGPDHVWSLEEIAALLD